MSTSHFSNGTPSKEEYNGLNIFSYLPCAKYVKMSGSVHPKNISEVEDPDNIIQNDQIIF